MVHCRIELFESPFTRLRPWFEESSFFAMRLLLSRQFPALQTLVWAEAGKRVQEPLSLQQHHGAR